MHGFVDEVAILSRWLGQDITAELTGTVPVWTAFRFRDAAVFEHDDPGSGGRMYLVRGESVCEFVPSRRSIDDAYVQLGHGGPLPTAA